MSAPERNSEFFFPESLNVYRDEVELKRSKNPVTTLVFHHKKSNILQGKTSLLITYFISTQLWKS